MKSFRFYLLLATLMLFGTVIFAQKKIKVSIVVTDLHLKYTLKGGTDPRVKIFSKSTDVLLNPKDAEGFNCLHLIDYKLPDAAFEYALNTIEWDLSSGTTIGFKLEGFEKNKRKGDCDFNGSGLFNKDNHHEFGEFNIDLKNIPPGLFSPKMVASTATGSFVIEYKVKYSLPAADSISSDIANGKYCSDKKITLTTSAKSLPNTEGLLYKWEFKSPITDNWELLTTTDLPHTQFGMDVISKEPISSNILTPFRVSLLTKEELSSSVQKTIEFLPMAPSIQTKDIITLNTCIDTKDGAISIQNINGITGKYLMVLRPTYGESGICFPENNAIPCKESDKIVTIETTTASIKKLAKGLYKLYITNNDVNMGSCYNSYPVQIEEHSVLEEVSKQIKMVSCNAFDDGELLVNTKGGNPGLLRASLAPELGSIEISDRSVKFKKLPAGKYQFSIIDSCNQKIMVSFSITEPSATKLDISNINKSTCVGTPNGSFTVNVIQGMGSFKYVLTSKEGKEISNTERTASPSNTFTNLIPGDYKLLVYSNGNDSCKPQEKIIIIESAITTIQVKAIKNVAATCEDCKTGILQFAAQDYKGALQYSLSNIINNQVYSNSNGLFEQLQVGKYKLMLKKSDNNCADIQTIDEVFIIAFTPFIPAVDTTKKAIIIDSTKKN